MVETRGVVAAMSQDAPSNDGPRVFTFRPWNSRVESWDDFKGALERAYSLYVDGCCRAMTVDLPGHEPAPVASDPDGAS